MRLTRNCFPWLIVGMSGLTFIASLFIGNIPLPLEAIWEQAPKGTPSLAYEIMWSIRFPRTAAAYTTGGLLAFAGCLSQTLFQNPLADSYLLGTSSGAALFMLIALLAGINPSQLPWFSGLGALVAVLAVLGCAKPILSFRGYRHAPTILLLTGVMVTAMINAVILLLLTILPEYAMKGMLFWIIGDLSYPEYWGIACSILVVAWLSAKPFGQTLTLLSYGPIQAKSLGVPIIPAYTFAIAAIAVTSGIAVAVAGPIGFIGLIAPHICRQWTGSHLKILLPSAIGMGGILLVIADTVARTAVAPVQLPVGIFTVLLGAPIFLWQLLSQKQAPL